MNWFDNENFWHLFYDWMFPRDSFALADKQVNDIINITGVAGGAVLDLCCGPGRHSVPLGKKGFRVTGVDLQPQLLDKAREYADRENVTLELVREDMLTFRRPDAFELVISMFSSFGYFNNPEEDFRVLENAYASLTPGGMLLMDVRGKEIHAMADSHTFSQKMPNGDLICHRSDVNDGWTRSTAEWIYIQGQNAHRFEMSVNLYSGAELKTLFERAGFSNVRIYGDLTEIPYNRDAKRLVALGTKA